MKNGVDICVVLYEPNLNIPL